MKRVVYIMIHGFCANKHGLDMLKLALLNNNPNVLILTPELKGHGEIEQEPLISLNLGQEDWTFNQYCIDMEFQIKALIKTYQIESFILVGHSLGGAIALELTKDPFIKSLIQKIVLINPAIVSPRKIEGYEYFKSLKDYFDTKKDLIKSNIELIKSVEGNTLFKKILRIYTLMRYKKHIVSQNVYTTYTAHFYEQQVISFNYLLMFFLSALNFLEEGAERFQDIINKSDVSTIILHGNQDDRFYGKDISKLIRKNPMYKLHLFDHLNHNAHEEDPELIASYM